MAPRQDPRVRRPVPEEQYEKETPWPEEDVDEDPDYEPSSSDEEEDDDDLVDLVEEEDEEEEEEGDA